MTTGRINQVTTVAGNALAPRPPGTFGASRTQVGREGPDLSLSRSLGKRRSFLPCKPSHAMPGRAGGRNVVGVEPTLPTAGRVDGTDRRLDRKSRHGTAPKKKKNGNGATSTSKMDRRTRHKARGTPPLARTPGLDGLRQRHRNGQALGRAWRTRRETGDTPAQRTAPACQCPEQSCSQLHCPS